jgi:hypothetical protein
MTYGIKITSAEKITVQSDGSMMLAVGFDVLENDAVIVSYNHGFPLDTSKEEIDAYLADFISNYQMNKERGEKNAEFDAANKVADETIEALLKSDEVIEASQEKDIT